MRSSTSSSNAPAPLVLDDPREPAGVSAPPLAPPVGTESTRFVARVATPAATGSFVARLLRHRVPFTLALAALFVFGTAFCRQRDETGVQPELLWADKLTWRGCADIVIAGDSRAYMDVAPAAMNRELPDCRILNYGFTGVALAPAYMERVAEVLDASSPSRAIVLAVTPHALTRHALEISEFEPRSRRSALENLTAHTEWLCQPLHLDRFWSDLVPAWRSEREYRDFHADGWVAIRCEPQCPRRELATYAAWYSGSQVDADIVADLLARVARWSAEGITVYGFRPPTTRDMVALELAESGFDESDFVTRFAAAGGVWLVADQYGYATADGSHLSADAARRFSRDLARLIRDAR